MQIRSPLSFRRCDYKDYRNLGACNGLLVRRLTPGVGYPAAFSFLHHLDASIMPSNLDQLRKDIQRLRRKAANERYYIDPMSLKDLCSPAVILSAVKECPFPTHYYPEIAKRISTSGFVTFSILVYIRQEHLIVKFLEFDLFGKLDDRLPMNIEDLESIAPGQIDEFFEVQWQFRPVILESQTYKQIGDKYILPFKEDTHHGDRDGSFGDIYEVIIESSMQRILAPEVT